MKGGNHSAQDPERRSAWREKVRAGKVKDPKSREKLCEYCGVLFCGLRYQYGIPRPDPRKRTCASAECIKMRAHVAGMAMKVYGPHNNQYMRREDDVPRYTGNRRY